MRVAEPRRALLGGAPHAKSHAKSAEDVVHAFGPNREAGLLDERDAKLRERYGPNELAEEPPEAIWKKLLAQFDDASARRDDPRTRIDPVERRRCPRRRLNVSKKFIEVFGALALVCTGCAIAEPPHDVRWSDAEPIVEPAPLPPPEPPRGRLLVHTKPRPAFPDVKGAPPRSAPSFHGYSVFDETGKLIFTCPGHLAENDSRWLRPGRYVAVATVKQGWFDYRERRIQFVIAPDRTTTIDFSAARDSTGGQS